MIRFLRETRRRRGKSVRLLLAFLAFIGTQAAFVRAAFPHVSRAATMRVIEQTSDAQSPQSSVDEGTVPSRGGRRGGPTVGTSAPTTPEVSESAAPQRAKGFATALEAPPSFVPPPLFHPPRAG